VIPGRAHDEKKGIHYIRLVKKKSINQTRCG